MIVDFVIKNYRSFKNEQVLSSYVGKVSSPNAHVLKEHPEYLSFLPSKQPATDLWTTRKCQGNKCSLNNV